MLQVENSSERRLAPSSSSRQYVRSAGIGIALLGLGGSAWAASALVSAPAVEPWIALAVAAVAVALAAAGAWVFAAARHLPVVEPGLSELWPNVAIIPSSLALGAALFGDALADAQRMAFLPLVLLILVGFHFLPLARIMGQRLYHQTGLWLIALALSIWAFVPQALGLWPVVSGIGGAAVLWLSACVSLRHLLPLLRDPRP